MGGGDANSCRVCGNLIQTKTDSRKIACQEPRPAIVLDRLADIFGAGWIYEFRYGRSTLAARLYTDVASPSVRVVLGPS